jgi:signal transduction histidine kinase
LTFSKGGEPVIEVSSLKDLINDIIPFTLTGSNIKYHITIEDDLLPVEMDANQISQVITNIVINSKQAMPDGGTIFVDSANVLIESDDVISKLAPGRYVMVSIKDQGIGIPDKIIDKVFDPFLVRRIRAAAWDWQPVIQLCRSIRGILWCNLLPVKVQHLHFFYLPVKK